MKLTNLMKCFGLTFVCGLIFPFLGGCELQGCLDSVVGKNYTITFDVNDGSSVEPLKAKKGATISAPINPTKENCTFKGWFEDEGFENKYSFTTMPEQDFTLYAKWVVTEGFVPANVVVDFDTHYPEVAVYFDKNSGSGTYSYRIDNSEYVSCTSGLILQNFDKTQSHTIEIKCDANDNAVQVKTFGYNDYSKDYFTESFDYNGQTWDYYISDLNQLQNIVEYLVFVDGIQNKTATTANPYGEFTDCFWVTEDIRSLLVESSGNTFKKVFAKMSTPMALSYSCEFGAANYSGKVQFKIEYKSKLNTDVSTQEKIVLNSNQDLFVTSDRTSDFDDFKINSFTKTQNIRTLYELESLAFGVKPIINDTTSEAGVVYNNAKTILRTICNDSMSDWDKSIAIYNWIAVNVTYDKEIVSTVVADNLPNYRSFTTYGALVDKVAVCDGIASAYRLLCMIEGIESVEVSGTFDGTGHAWNKTRIGNTWFGVDATWARTSETVNSYITHEYTICSDDELIASKHIENGGIGEMTPYINQETNVHFNYYTRNKIKDNYDLYVDGSTIVLAQPEINAIVNYYKNKKIKSFDFSYNPNLTSTQISNMLNTAKVSCGLETISLSIPTERNVCFVSYTLIPVVNSTPSNLKIDYEKSFPNIVLTFDCECDNGQHSYSIDNGAYTNCSSGVVISGINLENSHTIKVKCNESTKTASITTLKSVEKAYFESRTFTYNGQTWDYSIENENELQQALEYTIFVKGIKNKEATSDFPNGTFNDCFWLTQSLNNNIKTNLNSKDSSILLAKCVAKMSVPMGFSYSYGTYTSNELTRLNFNAYYLSKLNTEVTNQEKTTIVSTQDLFKTSNRTSTFNSFKINQNTKTQNIRTLYELENLAYGVKPVFEGSSSDAVAVYESAKTILRTICDDTMDDWEKTTAIYNWIVTNVTYDKVLVEMPTGNKSDYRSFTTYGALVDKVAVCDGISGAYKLLCLIEGIESIEVSGTFNSTGHSWNKTKIGTIWFGSDATWGRLENRNNLVSHVYTIMSEEELTSTGHVQDILLEEVPEANVTFNYFTNYIVDSENGYDLNLDKVVEANAQLELDAIFAYCKENDIDTIEFKISNNFSSTKISQMIATARTNNSMSASASTCLAGGICYIIF